MQRTLVAMLAAGAALAAGASNRGEEKRDVSSQNRGAEPRKRAHAQAKVTVHDSSATPYDQAGGPPLAEVHIRESFSGDFEGESAVRALQVRRDDGFASLVSMQRFRGRLGGREGAFVLQGSETVENGKIRATWFVVPGSATGGLAGLRGEGGIEGQFGQGSIATLDYWFE